MRETRIMVPGQKKVLSIEQHFRHLATLEASGDEGTVFKGLAYVYRAVLMRGDAITEIPFKILRGNRQWTNWPPWLAELFFAIECDLCVYGAAYVRIVTKAGLTDLQRLNPAATRIEAGPKGIKYFEFNTQEKKVKIMPKDMIYIRYYDPGNDLNPGVSPTSVALDAARLGIDANKFADAFFRHGAIPGIVLKSTGTVDEAERERATNFWDRLFSGVANKFRTAILSDDLDVKVIGAPPKDVAMADLMAEVRKQVAVAFGIPEDMLDSSASTYATAQAHAKTFWTYTVIPEAKRIEAAFNRQYFHKVGGYIRFETESTIVMSEEEAQRADALLSLVQSGLPLATALATLRYSIPEGFSIEPTAIPDVTGRPNKANYKRDLERWQKKALRRLDEDGEAFCTFYAPSIPWQTSITIMEGLGDAGTPEDVKKVFGDQRGAE